MKVYISPRFRGEDKGDGGIRRVVEAQKKWLPIFGFEIVDSIAEADLVATHAGDTPKVPVDKPWVNHNHGLYWAGYEWPNWCYDLNKHVIEAMRRADHVTAPSEWVAQALRRGMWLRPTVLFHGVDAEDWQGGKNKGYVLWNKNRPDPVCNPRPVWECAQRAQDLQFVTTFGRENPNIQITGKLGYREAQQYIKDAGVYLCTTRETFGIGTLEAMAAGVPVVAWAWGGQREIIEHGVTGWLATPGDHDGLVEGIRWALENRTVIAAAAKKDIADRWSWRQAIKRYSKLYQDVILRHWELNESPLVSVVIPAYNLARFLPDAIKSLQAQTFNDWEAVIVDDASPDETPEVAAKLAEGDPRVRVIRNPKNLYLAGALNVGVKEAKGRYILPLDADNMIAPTTLAILSDALNADRSIHIAYGAAQFVLEDGVTPDKGVSPTGISGWPFKEFRFQQQMLGRNELPSTSMYRRTVHERIGGYRQRYRTAEDADFWTRAVSYGAVPRKVTGGVTLIYRQRPESMSRNNTKPDWTAWLPWSRQISLVPFGAAGNPPPPAKAGTSWPVPSCEPNKIAVIIPVGQGHEELVIDALDSVEAQTYRMWECIVINDTGAPLEIPHPWVTVINTDGGVGPAKARNLALESTRCQLFIPLDADDYLQADALDILYAAWRQYGGVVYSQWWDDFGPGDVKVYDPPDYDARLLTSKGCIHAVTALYERALWKEVGGFDEALTHWEDWDFQLKMAKIGVCGVKVPTPLFTYRKTTGFRREDNHAAFAEGKAVILKKWGALWEGKETLMACSGCGRGGGVSITPKGAVVNTAGAGGQAVQVGEAVKVEYIGSSVGTITYKGKPSMKQYRFGNNQSHRFGFILPSDVEWFLSRPGEFRAVDQAAPTQYRPPSPAMATQAEAPVNQETRPGVGDVALQSPAVQQDPPKSEPAVVEDYSQITTRELKNSLANMTVAELDRALAEEEMSDKPRATAVNLIKGRLKALLIQ